MKFATPISHKRRGIIFLVGILLSCWGGEVWSQFYSDGPIEIMVRVRDVKVTYPILSDVSLNIDTFPPSVPQVDEIALKFWISDSLNFDGLGWVGGQCLFDTISAIGNTRDFMDTIYQVETTTMAVAGLLNLRMEAWEDDLPSDFIGLGPLAGCLAGDSCTADGLTCCDFPAGCLVVEGDDYHCTAPEFATHIDYRLSPPCTWLDHGYIAGVADSNNFYQPRIETFWKYANGEDFTKPIHLGDLNANGPFYHFNSNECYTNEYLFGLGNDVVYSFSVDRPSGVRISLCGGTTFDSRLVLFDEGLFPIGINDDFCGVASEYQGTVCDSGLYYILIDGADSSDVGTFTLAVEESPGQLPWSNAGPDFLICKGESQVIGGSPTGPVGTTITWSPSETLNNPSYINPTASPDTTMEYVVRVSNFNGCESLDTMKITVKETVVPTFNLVASDLVANPAFSWQWYIDDVPIVDGIDSSLTIQRADSGWYYVCTLDSNGCFACSEPQYIVLLTEDTVPTLEPTLEIFPNPFTDHVTLLSVSNGTEEYTLEVFDETSRMLYTSELSFSGHAIHKLNTSIFPPGIYLLRLQNAQHSIIQKIIKM